MKLFKRGKAKDAKSIEQAMSDPEEMPEPQNAADYLRRGYAYYARSQHANAITDFRRVITLDAEAVDGVYALGMALKANGQKEESVRAFQQVLGLLNAGAVADRTRTDMLRRLALGHINEMTSGDWNLEKEIWQHVE